MTGYVGFGNDTLDKLPKVKEDDLITCAKCKGVHKLEAGTSNGKKNETILFYQCGKESYLGALANRCVSGVKPDCSGKINLMKGS